MYVRNGVLFQRTRTSSVVNTGMGRTSLLKHLAVGQVTVKEKERIFLLEKLHKIYKTLVKYENLIRFR